MPALRQVAVDEGFECKVRVRQAGHVCSSRHSDLGRHVKVHYNLVQNRELSDEETFERPPGLVLELRVAAEEHHVGIVRERLTYRWQITPRERVHKLIK
jgi:hypothetical protein